MDKNLQKYMALIKTVETGSFTHAAELLQYSQSGVSRMIGDLEAAWGIALLQRGRGGVQLTSAGQQLLPYIRQMVSAYETLRGQVSEWNGLRAGLIRIGTFSSVATHWLPHIICAFQKDYPNIEYELLLGDYSEIEAWIMEGRVDCGFLRLPAAPELQTFFLEQDRLMAVVPEQHPLAACERIAPRALCDAPFLLLEKGETTEVSELFARCCLKPRVQFTTFDDYAIMSMVESGLGVSILPELILRRAPYRIAARPLDVPAWRNIGIALRDKKTAPLAVTRFLEYLDARNAPGLETARTAR